MTCAQAHSYTSTHEVFDALEPMPSLTPEEARVLGCLMEKSVTTPDNYPLSLNALVSACNQTTNRDPIADYSEELVDRTLDSLREKGLSRRVMATGQRVVKHRHVADETLGINAAEFAVLGVLFLRGAQTPGELKGRTERWHRFRSLEDVEEVLGRLAAREFTVQHPRRPGQKESRWAQLLAPEPDASPVAAQPVVAPAAPAATVVEPEAEPERPREPAVPHSIEVRDPATGVVVRSVAVTEESEIRQKLARARRAQPGWEARPYAERAAALRSFRDLLAAEADECAALTTRARWGSPSGRHATRSQASSTASIGTSSTLVR